MRELVPTLPVSRQRLVKVLSAAGDIIRIADAETALAVTRTEAAKILSRWTGQGWLRRVGPGVYAPAALDTLDSVHVLDDPWILVPVLYDPAYIGGRSAAEHWDLTEQIFRDIVVLTAQPLRDKKQQRHGATFSLKHIDQRLLFGTKTVWRGPNKIAVSDLHRTIIDMLDDPALGGGIQHIADCLTVYLAHGERDDETLLAYGDRLGNGAVFKRLGFLAERFSPDDALVPACRHRLTKGHAALDPALTCPRLVTRWKLKVPDIWVRSLWEKCTWPRSERHRTQTEGAAPPPTLIGRIGAATHEMVRCRPNPLGRGGAGRIHRRSSVTMKEHRSPPPSSTPPPKTRRRDSAAFCHGPPGYLNAISNPTIVLASTILPSRIISRASSRWTWTTSMNSSSSSRCSPGVNPVASYRCINSSVKPGAV